MSDYFPKGYQEQLQAKLQKALQPFLDKYWKAMCARNPTYAKHSPDLYMEVSVVDAENGCYGIKVGVGSAFKFTISHYPSCCSTSILHSFSCGTLMTHMPESLEAIATAIDLTYSVMAGADTFIAAKRAQIMMVEKSGRLEHTSDRTTVVPNIGNDEIRKNLEYPLFWDYFQSKQVESHRAHVNPNTGRIIHNLEVLI